MRKMALLALVLITATASAQGPGDSGELLRSAVEKQKARPYWFRPRNVGLTDIPFAYQYTARQTKFNGDGSVKKDLWWKEDVVSIDGVGFATNLLR